MENLDFKEITNPFFLIGLLSEFDNRYQAKADSFFKEMSWKQFFAIICIKLFEYPPTLKELSKVMGSSHQNVKQILIKLQKNGFLYLQPDEKDKRKQRIFLTEKTGQFCMSHDEESQRVIGQIFQEIDEKDLEVTIRTIIKMDKNLKGVNVE